MNFRTLDLNLLRVFDEIMSERNLTRAAGNLAMSQPAVSNALKRLRDALGDEIVVRSGHGVEPTQAAQQWWPVVREALAQLRATFAPGDFDPADSRTSFTVTMADATAALLVPPLMTTLEREAPGVSLRVLPLNTRDPRHLLATQDIDIAVGYFPAAVAAIASVEDQDHVTSQFHSEQLYSSDYICVMHREHPLADQELTLDSYCAARHLLVSFSGRPYGFIDEALAAMNRRRRVVLTVNQFFTAGIVVVNSDLLTVVPMHFVASTGMSNWVTLKPLPFSLPRVNVDTLWHQRRASRPGHSWLRDAIRRATTTTYRPPWLATRDEQSAEDLLPDQN